MDYNQEQFYKFQKQAGNKTPFYMTYPMQNLYMTELEYQQDMERMKELYPLEVRKVQELVEEECDKMEYEGSLMFDEYPDRLMLRRICDRIYHKTDDNLKMQGLIEVLLYNEMYNRRCRYRRCRRWW